jgi:HSP20 family protein
MLAKINRTYPSIFDEFLGREFYPMNYRSNGYKSTPAVNISEDENGFMIEVAAPGLEKKNFKIDLDRDVLTIASVMEDNQEDRSDHYTRREFRYSNFSRSFNLPETVDAEKISASHKNGILSVSLPKKEEAKPRPARQISIR